MGLVTTMHLNEQADALDVCVKRLRAGENVHADVFEVLRWKVPNETGEALMESELRACGVIFVASGGLEIQCAAAFQAGFAAGWIRRDLVNRHSALPEPAADEHVRRVMDSCWAEAKTLLSKMWRRGLRTSVREGE